MTSSEEALANLLYELVDPDDCRYDHHGYCQAHDLHENPCPHGRAKSLLMVLRPGAPVPGETMDEYLIRSVDEGYTC